MKKRNLKAIAFGLAVATTLTTGAPAFASGEVSSTPDTTPITEAAPTAEAPDNAEVPAPAEPLTPADSEADTAAPVPAAATEAAAPAEAPKETGSAPAPAEAEKPETAHTVEFVINGASKSVTYKSADEPIADRTNQGAPGESGSVLTKAYFIGWSPDKDYETNSDAKLYYSSEKVAALIQDGVTKLYPIYFSRTAILGLNSPDSGNAAYIDRELTDDQVVPDAELHREDTVKEDHRITVKYDETKTDYSVVLTSSFDLNKMVSHWLYTGNGSTIMTNTQGDKGSSAKDAKYTHVDLNVTLSDELLLADALKLTFNGYYFQPYMVFDAETGQKFEIEEVQGADKTDISELVSSTSPETTFTVKNVGQTKKLTVRTILRSNWGFGGKPIIDVDARKVETTKMVLSATNATISKDTAKKMVGAGSVAAVSGVVNGYVKMPNAGFGPFSFSLDEKIRDIVAKHPLAIQFRAGLVTFDKNSKAIGDAGEQNLGASRVAYSGSLSEDSFNDNIKPSAAAMGDTIADAPDTFVTDEGITYRFKGWNTQADGEGDAFTETTEVTEDLTVYAIWEMETVSETTEKKGRVIVRFLDTEGNSLSSDIEAEHDIVVSTTVTKKAGTKVISEETTPTDAAYDVTAHRQDTLTVNGVKYVFKEAQGAPIAGKITEGLNEVRFIYEKEKAPESNDQPPVNPDEQPNNPEEKPNKPEEKPNKPEEKPNSDAPNIKPDTAPNTVKPEVKASQSPKTGVESHIALYGIAAASAFTALLGTARKKSESAED